MIIPTPTCPPQRVPRCLLHDLRLRALLDLALAGAELLLQGAHEVVELLSFSRETSRALTKGNIRKNIYLDM